MCWASPGEADSRNSSPCAARPGCAAWCWWRPRPGRAAQGELLREPASPGDTQHIGLLIAELVKHTAQQRRRSGQMIREHRRRGPAQARHVEPDDGPLPIQRVDERLQHLQAGAEPVAHQQRLPRRVPLPHRDPQDAAADDRHGDALARAGPPRLARPRPAQAAGRVAARSRPGPGPGPRPQAYVPGAPHNGKDAHAIGHASLSRTLNQNKNEVRPISVSAGNAMRLSGLLTGRIGPMKTPAPLLFPFRLCAGAGHVHDVVVSACGC